MKSTKSLIIALFLSIFAFTACSNDNDDIKSSSLIGTWRVYTYNGYDNNGKEFWVDALEQFLTLKADGTGISSVQSDKENSNITWLLNEKSLTIKDLDRNTTMLYQIKEQSKNKIKCLNINKDKTTYVYYFTRI
ncbi:lipocalin family protein [uncultured Bacteroides sp.]|uniref:lipocalin family protein n=1 Tax=uncultured Bacteroides sp. TaxID=162156 RepID=UPI002AA6CE88|nr:lipocalin family protein [uncultured Bacteroides sp.]